MAEDEPKIQRKTTPLNAWFVKLDAEQQRPWQSGRLRILALLLAIAGLLILGMVGIGGDADSPRWAAQSQYTILALALGLLALLAWQVWRELLQPLLRLCDWAELMRGVHLDAKVEFQPNSDFSELERDINMLGDMIKNLSRDTEIQLQKHTDYISRESRSLAILYDVASTINLSHDLNELFEKSLESLCNNLNASGGIVRQFKGKNKKDIVASFGEFNRTFLVSADRFLPIQYPFDNIDLDRIYRIDRIQRYTVLGPFADRPDEQLLVLSVLLQYRKNILGAIHLFFVEDTAPDLESYNDLLLSIGQHLGGAVERFRLLEEEAQLLVMQERTRLSHELHDSLAQTIASLRIQIRVIDESFHAGDEKSIWHQMERIEYTIDQANHQLRELIAHIRIPIDEQGLIASIEETIRHTQDETGIPIYFQNEWPNLDFSTDVELNLLRIVQECLANVRKHSHAESVRVLLSHRENTNILLIEDDGIGFDESTVVSAHGHHLGLDILRDRARQIGARIDIESEPGDGTRISLTLDTDAPQHRLESTG